jgi:hypothetical protein
MFDEADVGTDHQTHGGAKQRDGKRRADDALYLLTFAQRAMRTPPKAARLH